MRRCRGWTENDLVERCRSASGTQSEGLTVATIRRIEGGQLPPPDGSRELCRHLAVALGCRFEDLAYNPLSAGQHQIFRDLLGPVSELWVRRIFAAQDRKSGGLYAGLRFSGFTQPWSSAQALVGALQVPGTTARYEKQICRLFAYFDRWRYPFGRSVEELSPEEEQGWPLVETEVPPVPVTEVTGWVLLAYAYALRDGLVAGRGTVAYLAAEVEALLCRQCTRPNKQNPVGGFCPTVQVNYLNQRTYSTVIALWTLVELLPLIREELERRDSWKNALAAVGRSARWLATTLDRRLGWVPNPCYGKRVRYPGLTAHALFVLTLLRHRQIDLGINAPIGYASALFDYLRVASDSTRLWQFFGPEGNVSINTGDVILVGTPYRLEGTEFYWAPWTLALVGLLDRCGCPSNRRKQESVQERLSSLRDHMVRTAHRELSEAPAGQGFGAPEIGETLYGIWWLDPGDAKHASRCLTNRSDLRETSAPGRERLSAHTVVKRGDKPRP